jgi:hypothetical protein
MNADKLVIIEIDGNALCVVLDCRVQGGASTLAR